jgi:small subunit ribosomal protein S21
MIEIGSGEDRREGQLRGFRVRLQNCRVNLKTPKARCKRSGGGGVSFPKLYEYSIIGNAPWQVWRWVVLAEVRVQEGEPLENALRRFKRKVQQEDIIKEVKRHSYYLKPGEKKRVKAALARKRNRKKARKEQD